MNQLGFFSTWIDYLKTTWAWPGFVEVGQFLGTHLISGMIPAFLIAGAIAVFLDKERITRLMGPKANPFISFPTAAFSGALLTVCSCGVVPIFTGIMTRGAGVGPAFTFLFAAPAINLIALTYTYSAMGWKIAVGRVLCVLFCAISIGLLMRLFFSGGEAITPSTVVMAEMEQDRTDGQTFVFFFLLIFLMLTSTGFFDHYTEWKSFPGMDSLSASVSRPLGRILPKLFLIFLEALIGMVMLKKWFHPDEVKQWLNKAWSLFWMIFPKVVMGIFLSGLLAALFPMSRYMEYFDHNTMEANFLIAFLGALMYLGTIVGVNVIATFMHFGMHSGPAMAFLLSGPSVSLPEIFALIPIMGRKKAMVYLVLVVITTALSGFVYGHLAN